MSRGGDWIIAQLRLSMASSIWKRGRSNSPLGDDLDEQEQGHNSIIVIGRPIIYGYCDTGESI